jgi:dihydroorotate dehydrogenase electron transfer subunit
LVRRSDKAILVGGGIGVAPLVALAEGLGGGRVIIGARTKTHIMCEEEFKALGCVVRTVTEDGSKGRKGLATDLLKDVLRTELKTTIYACGPTPMLKAVALIARANGISCQVSLEEHMACGVGVCLGCPVKVKTQYAKDGAQYDYKMVCKDGPVFNAEEVVW